MTRRLSTAAALAPRPPSPPTNDPNPNDEHDQGEPPRSGGELSDREWQLRTGAAIDLLVDTLPTFFHTGLVAHVAATPPPADARTGLSPTRDHTPSGSSGDRGRCIYSPKIRLSYTPPLALPSPFPRTFNIEGLPLYLSSAVFVRHTLNAIYTDLAVDLRTVRVNDAPSPRSDSLPQSARLERKGVNRNKSLFVGLTVSGRARVSGGDGHWAVNSTYHFHPATALVYLHTIDSIVPAPHSGVFNLLKSVLDGVGGRMALGPGGCVSVSPAPEPIPLHVPTDGEKGRGR